MKVLMPFLNKNTIFLEVGPGDCALSFEVAKQVKQVYAVDVSAEITRTSTTPENFQLILSNGCSISVPHHSIHVAYSNQLMEHLHPDDALEQLQNIYNALMPGGAYICITPNKLVGPSDISRGFDRTSTGFHLKEYTISELSILFKKVGFSKVRVCIGARGKYLNIPVLPLIVCEKFLDLLPYAIRKLLIDNRLFRVLLGIRLVAMKQIEPF